VIHKLLSAVIFSVAFGSATAQPAAGVSALDWAKKKCVDIGFKAGTERFGNCVLQLSRSDEAVVAGAGNSKSLAVTSSQIPTQESKRELTTFKDCDECPEMVVIPAGKFLMGSKDDPFGDPPPSSDEMPQREVAIKGFSLGRFEITQEQWYRFMGTTPSNFKGGSLPVENITWEQAQEFVEKLRMRTGKNYRFPTEAEWEYSAKAGSKGYFSFGNDVSLLEQFAWFSKNSRESTWPVGTKKPNDFGIFDMQGNVWEWTQDCWTAGYQGAPNNGKARLDGDCSAKTIRGGSWLSLATGVRATYRYKSFGAKRDIGLRVARDN
jgi:formylglycine-generating enzyme required for sulfatase activity